MGYHCWLCGKNSNSKKQWQQHIQSEKHKEKVFTSDSDASGWAYRFPMGEFRLCDRCRRGGQRGADRRGPGAGEAGASSGSSWPGGGLQGVVCPETADPGCEEHGAGQDRVGGVAGVRPGQTLICSPEADPRGGWDLPACSRTEAVPGEACLGGG